MHLAFLSSSLGVTITTEPISWLKDSESKLVVSLILILASIRNAVNFPPERPHWIITICAAWQDHLRFR
jgi:hypothetical protein